ncbi:hypothetical protein [Paraburkholderia aspalathi]|uniref:hypothetical protein n=1 Tax=Paraburkholderia aspalathi TaxID=1324617 RepID=UPI0038BB0987
MARRASDEVDFVDIDALSQAKPDGRRFRLRLWTHFMKQWFGLSCIAMANIECCFISFAIAQDVASMANRSDRRLQILIYPTAAVRSQKVERDHLAWTAAQLRG